MHQPSPDDDRRWLEAHVLKGEGPVLYGRLADELDQVDPAELLRDLRAAAEPYVNGGADRAREAQRRLDDLLERLLARDQRFGYPPPFCHKGCCACCHEIVYATGEEVRALLAFCREQDIPIDRDRLRRQLAHVQVDGHGDHTGATTWSEQPEEDQACVFLGADGACRVWPARPLVCRAHLAEGSAAHCRPHNGVEDPEARGISYLEASCLITAVFTLHRDTVRKTLPRLLLDALEG